MGTDRQFTQSKHLNSCCNCTKVYAEFYRLIPFSNPLIEICVKPRLNLEMELKISIVTIKNQNSLRFKDRFLNEIVIFNLAKML